MPDPDARLQDSPLAVDLITYAGVDRVTTHSPGSPNAVLVCSGPGKFRVSIGFGPLHYCGNRDPEAEKWTGYTGSELRELWYQTGTVEILVYSGSSPTKVNIPWLGDNRSHGVYGWVHKDRLQDVVNWCNRQR